MKSIPWLALALTLFSSGARGQVSPTPAADEPVLVEVGPNSRTWSIPARDSTPTGAPPGSGTANGSEAGTRVVEIATGMNYWDGQQWVPSDPSFDVTQDAFVATRLQHKVRLGADLNTIGAVTRYEIMAYAAEARSRALGRTPSVLAFTRNVDLQTIWPVDPQYQPPLQYSRHKWHSAQFRSTNMRQKDYWRTLLSIQGFDIQ